jgi:hypothetical protein
MSSRLRRVALAAAALAFLAVGAHREGHEN